MSFASERKDLLEKLEMSRNRFSAGISDLGGALNVPRRIKSSIRRRPVWWVGGGIAAGFVLARVILLGRRRKKGDVSAPVKRSLFLGLLGIAGKQILRQARPALYYAAREKLKNWFSSSTSSPPAAREGDGPAESSEESNATTNRPDV